jgi:hypothetical protein
MKSKLRERKREVLMECGEIIGFTYFMDLPVDIRTIIIMYCDHKDIGLFRIVSKETKKLIENNFAISSELNILNIKWLCTSLLSLITCYMEYKSHQGIK